VKPGLTLTYFEAFVMDNPRRPREHVLGYLHRVAVGVGAIEPDEKPVLERRMPRVPKNPALATAPTAEYADEPILF